MVLPEPILEGAMANSTGPMEFGASRSNTERQTEIYGRWWSFQIVTNPKSPGGQSG